MSTANQPCGERRGGTLSSISPRQRPQALSPRRYQARLDACRVYDLIVAGKTQAEIAVAMGKDPAWVSRTIKLIRSDFSTVFVRSETRRLIDEHLAQIESLYRQALQAAEGSTGMAKISALRLATEVFTKRAEYQRSVGLLPDEEKLRQENDEDEMISLRELKQSVPQSTLDAIILRSAEDIKARRNGTEPPWPRARPLVPQPEAKPRVFGHRRIGN